MAGNCLVALTKFVAGAWTGGSAMIAEGVHSLVDTGNQILLLYGLRRAEQRPSPERPLGHGREIYFWSFIVALLIFSLGAGVAMLEGVLHILNPRAIEDASLTPARSDLTRPAGFRSYGRLPTPSVRRAPKQVNLMRRQVISHQFARALDYRRRFPRKEAFN